MTRWILWAPTGRAVRRLVGGLIAAVVVASIGSLVWFRMTELPADTALRVDGKDISRNELDRRVHMLDSLFGIHTPGDPAGQDRFRRDSAHAIAVSTVLDQAAAQRGIEVPDKVARDTLDGMIDKQMGPQGRQAYVQLLSESGASEGDVLEEIKRQLRTQQLSQQIASPTALQVTPADAASYFRDHPAEMITPEQRHLRNIVVASQPEADDIARRLGAGEDFVAVASQSSLDQSTRNSGGDLGWLSRDRLEEPFAPAAFGAAPGALVGPVKTGNGWNVGQVLEVHPAVPMTLDQVQPALLDRLRSERVLATWRGWMDQQVRGADVQYADDLRPPAAPPPPPATPSAPESRPQGAASSAPAPAGSITSTPAAETSSAQPSLVAASSPGPAAPSGAQAPPPRAEVSSAPLTAITLLLLGAGLVAIGVWGWRTVDDLVPTAFTPARQARKRRSLRRGAATCLVVGALMVVLAMIGVTVTFF
jgi:peptidyl-prolyl cis-trans isomerase C